VEGGKEVSHLLLLRPRKGEKGAGIELRCGNHGCQGIEISIYVRNNYFHMLVVGEELKGER
jgi:hypothetical protein